MDEYLGKSIMDSLASNHTPMEHNHYYSTPAFFTLEKGGVNLNSFAPDLIFLGQGNGYNAVFRIAFRAIFYTWNLRG